MITRVCAHKVFANYRKWCAHLDVRPQFSGLPDPSDLGRVGGKAADLLLWFFIWGEAANLRHMPESLCFLYHKSMQSWKARSGHSLEGGQRYPGHFLDNTVTPIYDVVKRASSAKKVKCAKMLPFGGVVQGGPLMLCCCLCFGFFS